MTYDFAGHETHKSGSFASSRTQSGVAASVQDQPLSRQQSSQPGALAHQQTQQQLQQQLQAQQMHTSQQLGSQQPLALMPNAALASIPEDEPVAAQKVKKMVKKRRRKKIRRGSKLTQPGGMTDQEKSLWLLQHCKVITPPQLLHADQLACLALSRTLRC